MKKCQNRLSHSLFVEGEMHQGPSVYFHYATALLKEYLKDKTKQTWLIINIKLR